MRKKQAPQKTKQEPDRPKKKKEYPKRSLVKDKLKKWEDNDWEEFQSDSVQGE